MPKSEEVQFWHSTARAFGGALIFSFPLLMTMEMWWMGFYLSPVKHLLFVLLLVPVLFGTSVYSGFESTPGWRDDALEALVAFAIGVICSAFFLALLAVLWVTMPLQELIGKTILLSVPASIGAIVASKELGQQSQSNEGEKQSASYWGEVFIMLAGALFFAFSVAPTIEMLLLGFKMTPWHSLATVLVSVFALHVIVYEVGFRGQEEEDVKTLGLAQTFVVYSLVGYGVALLTSAYLLWTFGRFDGLSFQAALQATIVLALPASLGAGISRIVL